MIIALQTNNDKHADFTLSFPAIPTISIDLYLHITMYYVQESFNSTLVLSRHGSTTAMVLGKPRRLLFH